MKKRFFSWLLCLVMCISLMPTVIFAEDVDGSKVASPDKLTYDNRQTEVTLSLPSAEYHYDYDIVFCMDSSTSIVNSNINFADYASDMLETLSEHDANIKVGVVKFRGLAYDTISLVSNGGMSGLVKYDKSNADAVYDAVNFAEADLKNLSSGTNVTAGLEMADAMLAGDTSVEDSHKFLIMLTDGKTYIWNDNGVPTTNYTQWYRHFAIQSEGAAELTQGGGCSDKPSYSVNPHISQNFLTEKGITLPDVCWYKSYADLYASTNSELSSATKYDMKCLYAYKQGTPTGTVKTYTSTNGADIFDDTTAAYRTAYEFSPSAAWSDITWFEANPFDYTVNSDGTVTFTKLNPDFYQWHPDALMKGLYKSGHLWTELDSKYNTGVVTYDGWGGASGLEIAKDFCSWIRSKSDIGADILNAQDVTALFDSIQDQILYMIAKGTVTDIIPEEFTLVDNGTSTFTVTVGGTKFNCTGSGNAWNFGTASDGVYPYSVSFDPASNTFTWAINVPVENAKPVKLSYKLEIDKDAANGDHDTNVSAVLKYTTSTSEPGSFIFEVPVVNYFVPAPVGDLTVTKSVSGNAADNTKAFDFTAILSDKTLSGVYGDMNFTNGVAKFTLKDGENKTATGLPAGINYEVAEADYSANGYVTTKTGDKGTIVGDDTMTAAFINTRNITPSSEDPYGPQTGDNSNLALWFALLCISGGALIGTSVYGRKKKNKFE